MATKDHKPSRTKHRRNSNNETQNPSKRHKPHHHHYHHRSKTYEIMNVLEHVPPHTHASFMVSNGDKQLDYDMEEGEIVDIGVDTSVKFGCSDHLTEEVSIHVENSKGKVGSGPNPMLLKEAKSDVSSRVSAVPVRKGESSLNTDICDGVELQRKLSAENHVNDFRECQHGSRDSRVYGQILETSDCNKNKGRKKQDREMERKRNRGTKEMARERDRDRDRDRDRVRDKERWDRERERDRDREEGGVRNSHRCKYQDLNNIGDPDKHSDHMHQRSLDKEYRQRSRTNEKEQVYRYETDNLEMDTQRIHRDEVELEDVQEMVLHIAEQEEEVLSGIKEESRRRRQAILEKYKAQQSQQKHELKSEETAKESSKQPSKLIGEAYSSPNKSTDMIFDDTSFSLGTSPEQTEPPALKNSSLETLGEGTPKSKESDHMFCVDFCGDSPAGVRKQGKGAGLKIERSDHQDNWDDAEGYYKYRIGELLDGRYEVVGLLGQGVFSNVVRASDREARSCHPEMVAIKIIRCNDITHKAGLGELVILKKLIVADPKDSLDKQHCVRFLSSFKYKNHLCLVFESLDMNLRQYLKKVGCNIKKVGCNNGLELTVVRDFAKQLFTALEHLKNCGVLHSDIKPDNMLVNKANTVLKLSDFGSAMLAGENEITTPYLVSRFYRAPEIILGLSYDHPMDIWSVGCCLYEFYTGKVLFPGTSNNDMLRLHMELKGSFPKKMLRKGAFTHKHFDKDLNFLGTEEDPFTKKAIRRQIRNFKLKSFSTILPRFVDDDQKMFASFKDLLDKIFVLNPDKRITVSEALSHPFIIGK